MSSTWTATAPAARAAVPAHVGAVVGSGQSGSSSMTRGRVAPQPAYALDAVRAGVIVTAVPTTDNSTSTKTTGTTTTRTFDPPGPPL